jgi:hypothetical protein
MSDGHPPAGDDEVIRSAVRGSAGALVGAGLVAGVAILLSRTCAAPAPAPVAPPQPVGPAERPTDPAPAPLGFVDAARDAGIDFGRTMGADGRWLLPETMGGGVAIWDVDLDDRPDLLFVDGDRWPGADASGAARGQGTAVFLNRTAPGGALRFERARGTGLESPWPAMGLALADLDGDGRPEIVTTGVDGVRLHRAVPAPAGAPPRWVDSTEASGLAAIGGWTTAAAFADFDRDGVLELVLGRYVEWSPDIDRAVGTTLDGLGRAYGAPTGFAGTDLVLLAQDPTGKFVDRTSAAGLADARSALGEPICKALAVLPIDADSDGDLDLFVANDTVRNLLFVNDGGGRFTERGVEMGVAFDRAGSATGAMGCDAAWIRPGTLAIAVGNFANEPASLFTSDGRGPFADDAVVEGISAATRRTLAFGTGFIDLDGDGDEDLVLANGHIEPRIATVQPSQSWMQRAQAFRNSGPSARGRAFVEWPAESLGGLATPTVGRGMAWADLDVDGRLDVVIAPVEGQPVVAVRPGAASASWLDVVLDDATHPGNRAAIGAEVAVTDADGRILRRRIMPTRSYLSQVPPSAWFGLGGEGGPGDVASIEVRWPDGARSTHAPGAGRGRIVLRRDR